MYTTGIILAAGQSRRLAGKVLLPTNDGRIVIESALCFAKLVCDELIVVTNGTGVVERILDYRGTGESLRYVTQPASKGVCDAISRGCCGAGNEKCIILFGDNFYDESEADNLLASIKWNIPLGSVREFKSCDLDGWDEDENEWVSRGGLPHWKLAGWLSLSRSQGMRAEEGLTLYEYLNEIGAANFQLTKPSKWADLGTYSEYCRHIKEM